MTQGQVGFAQAGALSQFNQPGLWLPGDSRSSLPPMVGYLRQLAMVAFGPSTLTDYIRNAVLPVPCLGASQNSRLVFCQAIAGPGAAANYVVPPGGIQPSIDVGGGGASNVFSTDILIWNELAADHTNNGGVNCGFGVNSANVGSYVAGIVLEYIDIDQSNYGFSGNTKDYNGNVDYDGSAGGTGTGDTVTCTRTGGQTCNYSPELGIWFVGGTGAPPSVNSTTYNNEGIVSDGGNNIWLAVQDGYFNAVGLYNPVFNLSGVSGTWYWANLTMKTLTYP